jgi:hypothetical protein
LKAKSESSKKFDEIAKSLGELISGLNYFESIWVGKWHSQSSDNYFWSPDENDEGEVVRMMPKFINSKLEERTGFKIDSIHDSLNEMVGTLKDIQKEVIIELSIIKDEEKFGRKPECRILKSLIFEQKPV